METTDWKGPLGELRASLGGPLRRRPQDPREVVVDVDRAVAAILRCATQ